MKQVFVMIAMVCVWAFPASAQSPQEMVRWIYLSETTPGPSSQKGFWYVASAEQRGNYFSRRMVAFFDANDSYGDNLAESCIDFYPSIPGNDFDAAELARTLQVRTQTGADLLTVTAQFSIFGSPNTVSYDFVPENGFWRIDDIVRNGNRMSHIPCVPKQAATATPVTAYCFQKENEGLRLDLDGAGGARLEFWSWQTNGHLCSGRQSGREEARGWRFPGAGACNLDLQVLADGGVELNDPDWACKPALCGQRAAISAMRFPHASRIDCAAWRGLEN